LPSHPSSISSDHCASPMARRCSARVRTSIPFAQEALAKLLLRAAGGHLLEADNSHGDVLEVRQNVCKIRLETRGGRGVVERDRMQAEHEYELAQAGAKHAVVVAPVAGGVLAEHHAVCAVGEEVKGLPAPKWARWQPSGAGVGIVDAAVRSRFEQCAQRTRRRRELPLASGCPGRGSPSSPPR
jgi:hypothetical protein